jgi:hypothetical protein
VGVSSWGFEEPSTGVSCPWFPIIRTIYSSLRISLDDDRWHPADVGQVDNIGNETRSLCRRLSSTEAICFGVGVLYPASGIIDGKYHLGSLATDERLMQRLRTTYVLRRRRFVGGNEKFSWGSISSWSLYNSRFTMWIRWIGLQHEQTLPNT